MKAQELLEMIKPVKCNKCQFHDNESFCINWQEEITPDELACHDYQELFNVDNIYNDLVMVL